MAAAIDDRAVDSWETHRSRLKQGDMVVIWQAEDDLGRRGVVALGEVVSDIALRDDAPGAYNIPAGPRKMAKRVDVRLIPTKRKLWLHDPHYSGLLSELTISRSRNPVCCVTADQFERIKQAAEVD